jgi:methyltransferase (TIGR00027 family)
MVRTENDSWDIATSVGATAVMVALARAAETSSTNPLIRDDYAETLVSTPELAEVREQIASMWRQRPEDDEDAVDAEHSATDDDVRMNFQQMVDYQAVRTHFFDEFFAAAGAAPGIRQVVILAAGLDSRAYRLNWPSGTTVFEIDQPKVLEYKTSTLNQAGVIPSATRREVAVDLRHDWPAALCAAGFDPDVPTAWLAEGLLPFLPGQAQESMFAAIDGLSAPGSRIAVEVFGVDEAARREVEEQWRQARAEREARGEDTSFDPLELWYHDDVGPECADWFAAHGWRTRSVDTRGEFERLGRPMRETPGRPRPFVNAFVTAEKPRQPVG